MPQYRLRYLDVFTVAAFSFAFTCIFAALSARPVAAAEPAAKLLEVRKIWDKGPHNAFTDLIRFDGRWFCTFREGKGHVSPDGTIRVITSKDGETWESAALITDKVLDLRDPKISITPDGQLMIVGAGCSDRTQKPVTHQSFTWFSKDGKQWSEPTPVAELNQWLWRVTWHKGTAYGVSYLTTADRSTRLYASKDGRKFEAIVPTLYDIGSANEASLLFRTDDTAICLQRCEKHPKGSVIGMAKAPYTEWTWKETGTRIGGPHHIQLADGRIVGAVRLYTPKVRTSLVWINPEQGKIEEFLTLPSNNDTSYAGLVEHEGQLWVSYYSSHEGKTSIYLAKVQLPSK